MPKNVSAIVVRPSNTNWGDEGVQVDEAFPVDEEVDSIDTHVRSDKQTGGDDGYCALEDERDDCVCCVWSVWICSGHVFCKEVRLLNNGVSFASCLCG